MNPSDWVQEQTLGYDKIEEAILGVVGGLDKPGSPAGEAIQAFHAELNGRGKACTEQFRNQVLAVTEADLKRVDSHLSARRCCTDSGDYQCDWQRAQALTLLQLKHYQ